MFRDAQAVDLRDHYDALWAEREKRLDERWRAQDAAVGAAFAAAKEALVTATSELAQKLVLLNELRGNVLPREEYDAKHEQHEQEIGHLRDAVAEINTRVAVGPPELNVLRRKLDRSTGERTGHISTIQATVSILAAASGWALLLASIVTHGFN